MAKNPSILGQYIMAFSSIFVVIKMVPIYLGVLLFFTGVLLYLCRKKNSKT